MPIDCVQTTHTITYLLEMIVHSPRSFLFFCFSSALSADAVLSFGFFTKQPMRRRSSGSTIRGGGSITRFAATLDGTNHGNASTQSTLSYNASAVDAGSLSLEQLFDLLQTSRHGLSQDDAASRWIQFGPNTLDKPGQPTIWKLIAAQFQDRLVQILLAVAVLSAIFSYAEHNNNLHSSSLFQAFVEPLVILTILLGNAAVGIWQTVATDDALGALQTLQPRICTVLRNDEWLGAHNASQLVPGDIIQVRVGDKVPADGRVVSLLQTSSSSLHVDQGSLTGESTTVAKLPGPQGTCELVGAPIQDQRGMIYAGTMVTRGNALVLVTQTGMQTQMGKIQRGVTEANQDQQKTPLGIKLDEFGETLTVIIGVICLAVWIISIPKMNDPSFHSVWEGAIYYAKVAVALGVAAIPEGLPAVITLCLSLGTRRMAERNVIVRKLPSVETLGCTSVICTDKTGTLTTNEMTVVSLAILEHNQIGDAVIKEHAVEGVSYSPIGVIEGIQHDKEILEHPLGSVADVAAVSALCNDAKIIGKNATTGSLGSEKHNIYEAGKPSHLGKSNKQSALQNEKPYERIGEPTEAALCVLTEKIGGMSHYLEGGQLDSYGLHLNIPSSVLASANVDSWRETYKRLATLEFNRDRKSMSVLCEFAKGNYPSADEYNTGVPSRKAGNRLLVKGAPNLLIERCTYVKLRDGTISKMTGELRRSIEKTVSEMAARPLRCLALAVKDCKDLDESLQNYAPNNQDDVANHPLLSDSSNYKNIESGLTLVGVVGIKDPARPEVAASILQCTRAGIRVMMITGDAKDTAVAIAREVNILQGDGIDKPFKAYEGREFFTKPEHEQLSLLQEDNIVFCRTEPADKQKLVKMLQKLGEIAAMTGDGMFWNGACAPLAYPVY
jgi:Ca2+-transporting ATPase